MASLTGGCLCGRLRYTIVSEPSNPHYCSCRQCQRWSGAPVVAWIDALLDAVRFDGAGGQPTWHRSSVRARRGFCAECGGTVCALDDGAAVMGIATASLDEPGRFRPVKWSFPESAPAWLPRLLADGKRD
ncbi:MAG: GFA family protein [Alphaproteobacteria bacterium]